MPKVANKYKENLKENGKNKMLYMSRQTAIPKESVE